MKAVCTTLGCWAAAAAPTAGLGGLLVFPASEPLLLIMTRSPSGLLWICTPADVEAGGVTSIVMAECGAEDERTGMFRVLPGATAGPAKVFLEGGLARPLISREGE